MVIRDLFSKDINRSINGVIKVSQSDEESIQQELSEYVVTRRAAAPLRVLLRKLRNRPRYTYRQNRRMDFGLLRLGQVALPENAVVPVGEQGGRRQGGNRLLRRQARRRDGLFQDASLRRCAHRGDPLQHRHEGWAVEGRRHGENGASARVRARVFRAFGLLR